MSAADERAARRVHVEGRVQGVAFRWHARDQALRLGVSGWVRNCDDGSVEVWVEGEVGALREMLAWLERGPPAARVTGVRTVEVEPEGGAGFEIRR